MKIFISWSGDRSRALAEELHTWIPLIIQPADCWLSASDIQAGARWGDNIKRELEVVDACLRAMCR